MKKVILILLSVFSFMSLKAQIGLNNLSSLPYPPIFGASPFQDSLWAMDTATFAGPYYASAPFLTGFTLTGITGMVMHPHTGEYFVIMKVSAVSGRVLGKYNPITGECTQIGNLGDNFSTITFREDGQLFGVTGDGATVPETLFLIDDSTGTPTVAAALGAGADGEVICYNFDNGLFYHWSGNGTVVMESVLSVAPYTATNIPISGSANGETFGAVYTDNGIFLISNISSAFINVNTSGVYSGAGGNNPDDLRGLGIVGRWVDRLGNDTVCANDSSLFVAYATSGGMDRHKFQWTLNGVNIPGATSSTYYGNQAGWYNCRIILDSLYTNGQTFDSSITVYTDTAWYGRHLHILNVPNVTLNPSSPAYLCGAGDTIQLTGSSGGSSQWYLNGSIIPGATTNTYNATMPGSYNMTKTNLNGCSDSSSTPLIVMYPPVSSMTPTGGSSICAPNTMTLSTSPGADSYQWLRNDTVIVGETNDTIIAGTTGDFTCIVTYGNCSDTVGNYQLVMLDCSGIEDNHVVSVNLFPNPAHAQLNITLADNKVIEKIEILDLTGRKLLTKNPNASNITVDIDNLRNGNYLVMITTKSGTITRKFVKY